MKQDESELIGSTLNVYSEVDEQRPHHVVIEAGAGSTINYIVNWREVVENWRYLVGIAGVFLLGVATGIVSYYLSGEELSSWLSNILSNVATEAIVFVVLLVFLRFIVKMER